MSSTRNFLNTKIIDAGSMTGTAVITSTVIDTKGLSSLGIQATWTGAAVGTFAFQVSNNEQVDWATVALDKLLTNPNNNAGTSAGQLNVAPYKFVRLIYTNTSSTGTLNAWISGKGQ